MIGRPTVQKAMEGVGFTRFTEQSSARESLLAFLENAGEGRVLALYGLNTRLSLLADFTADRAALLRGLARYAPAENLDRTAAAPRPAATGFVTDGVENLAGEIEARYYMPERRVRPTIAALTAIADRIAGMPGRKNLLWISGSFPIAFGLARNRVFVDPLHDAATFGADLETLARRLNSADIAVYPVNTAGVASLDQGVEDHLSPMGSVTNAAMNPILSATLHPDSNYTATLAQIADWTGGIVSSSNDIGDQLRKAFEDGRQGYLIGFYAPDWDGKFHELRVKVHHAGAKVRVRQGYYAVDEPAIDPANRLHAAMANTADSMEIPMDVAAAQEGSASSRTVTTRAHVPGNSLAFESTVDGWVARVKLVFVQMDATGREIWQFDRDLAMKLSETNHAKAAAAGLRFTTPIAMRAGAEQLRVLLQDMTSGAVGSVTMEVHRIPPGQ
jgi:VWFA-related protein